jgi:pathogenesis-related protein 1
LTQTESDATVLTYNALWSWWNQDGRSVVVDAGFDAEADGTIHPIPGQGFKGLEWTDEVLEIHNAERASFGVKPLKWDTALAAGAKTYAQTCSLKPSLTRGLGESLAMGTGVDARNAPKMLAAIWANEIFDWNCTTDKCSSGLCNHHRQMVWAETTKVGCGFAACSTGFSLVCRYDVAGNVGSRHPLDSLGPRTQVCAEQPGFAVSKKTRSVEAWGSWGGGAGNLLAACLSGYGLFTTGSWGGSVGGSSWSGSSGGAGWGSDGQGWGSASSGSSWGSSKGWRWDSESTWGSGGASVCGGSVAKSGWKRSWGSSSSGWNTQTSVCGGAAKSGWKRTWGSSGCESKGWGASGSLSWGGSTPDCGGWSVGQLGWGGGRAGWGSSSGGGWRVEGSAGAQGFSVKIGGQNVQTRNPVLEWYNVDGRSARVDPGVQTKEDGTVVALSDSSVSGTHYIGALPRNTAIVVIVVCCCVGILLLVLVAAFVVKKRRASYVDTV